MINKLTVIVAIFTAIAITLHAVETSRVPPHVLNGQNLAADLIDSGYPEVYVRGNSVVIKAVNWSYRSIYVVLDPKDAVGSVSNYNADSQIDPSYCGYLYKVDRLRKRDEVSVPLFKFHDRSGAAIPRSSRLVEIGIVFNGGPPKESGSGGLMPLKPG